MSAPSPVRDALFGKRLEAIAFLVGLVLFMFGAAGLIIFLAINEEAGLLAAYLAAIPAELGVLTISAVTLSITRRRFGSMFHFRGGILVQQQLFSPTGIKAAVSMVFGR